MQSQCQTNFESLLAKAMLEEVLLNKNIKAILGEIAERLHFHVLPHAMNTIKEIKQFADLPANSQIIFNNLAIKHSKDDASIGALLPNYSQDELLQIANLGLLLATIEKTLTQVNIENISTIQEILSLIKTFDDMGMYYFLDDTVIKENLSEYELIKNMVFLTQEETDMRWPRKEKCYAVTYGISTKWDKDLKTNDVPEKCFSGKAKYIIPPVESRFQMWMDRFDNAVKNNHEQEKINLTKILNYYDIPLDKTKRESTAYYAKRYQPWFEKLAKNELGDALPLVASPSSSTARLFITLLHLNLFDNSDGTFNLDKAQIVANCTMAYFLFCGHHSFLEVIEIWNRMLDYIAIYQAHKLPASIFTATHSENHYINHPNPERALPYARINNYKSFFHRSYADRIMEHAKMYSNNEGENLLSLGIFGSRQSKNKNVAAVDSNKNIVFILNKKW